MRLFLASCAIVLGKSRQHNRAERAEHNITVRNVLNLLRYKADIKDNFEQGGIVPLSSQIMDSKLNFKMNRFFFLA